MDDEELPLVELSPLDLDDELVLLALPEFEEDEPNKEPKMPEEDEDDNDGEDVDTEDVIEEGDKDVAVAVGRVAAPLEVLLEAESTSAFNLLWIISEIGIPPTI